MSHTVASDIDIVVGSPPRTVLSQALDTLHAINLYPVVVNQYDAGGSASVYMATESAEDGLQLDMFFDPGAVGRLGLRTDALLASAVQGARWHVVAPEYQAVYLLRKRHWKGDRQKIDVIRKDMLGFNAERIEKAIESSAGRDIATSVRRLLRGNWHSFRTPVRNLLADQYRRAMRLRHPVGFWTEIIGANSEQVAKDLAQRFDRFLITRTGPRPGQSALMARWLVGDVAALRWKPGLFISWSSRIPQAVRADIEITDVETPVEDLARRAVSAMETRLRIAQTA